jgi:TonB-linked SusC/RagA family outer membrane protein
LKYRVNFGPDFSLYRDGEYVDGESVTRKGTSFASLTKNQTLSYTLDHLLYYDKTIGKHNFGTTFLQSQTKYDYESSAMSADNIPFASQKWNALTNSNVSELKSWSSGLTQKQLTSYMGRVNYGFDNRYLLTLSGRWDGASQLAEGHKWSFFPSAALAWRIEQEKFMQSVSWVDALKLRLGVGITGNSAIDAYTTKGGLDPLFYPYGSASTAGTKPSTTLANQNLGWEKTTQYNLGIDFAVLKGRVSGIVDVYTSQTKDLLMQMSIPSITAYTSTYANIGETANKGIDITLNTVNVKTRDFEWSTNLNASWQKDHIVSLSNGKEDDINNVWFIGQSQGVIYGYQSSEIWQEADVEEMAKFNANGHKFQPGNARPVDQNDDDKIDANNDRVVIGHTRPRWILGMTNAFSYKGLELSVFLYGRMNYTYNTGGEDQGGRSNQRRINYYNENNKNSEYQKPIYSTAIGDPYSGILGYRNGSFIKVRNISLAYNFSSRLIQSWKMSNLRLYVQATNPGMLYSKIDHLDMDVVSSTWNRNFTVGINVGF